MAQRSTLWYVAIALYGEHGAYRGDAGVDNKFGAYRKYIESRGGSVVAELHNVTDVEMNDIFGFDETGKQIGEKKLENLVRSLNEGLITDVSAALVTIRKYANKKC